MRPPSMLEDIVSGKFLHPVMTLAQLADNILWIGTGSYLLAVLV